MLLLGKIYSSKLGGNNLKTKVNNLRMIKVEIEEKYIVSAS